MDRTGLKVVAKGSVELKSLKPPAIGTKAFAHVASKHLNPKAAAFDRPAHAEITLAGLNFAESKAMGERRVEIRAVRLVCLDCLE